MKLLFSTIALALVCLQAAAQTEQEYPARPVRVVISSAPGGSVDSVARVASAYLEQRFRQAFVVENRPGANGLIATEAVVRARPDGYALLITTQLFIIEQGTNKDWPLQFERDLTPISILSDTGYALAISNSIPVTNLRELIAYNKANPRKLNEAQPAGFNADIALLKHAIGLGPVELIPYAGAAPAMQAILSGEVHMIGTTVLSIDQIAKAGKVKVIAYTGRKRHPLMPQVPTVNEAGVGVSDFEASLFMALLGPAGLPAEIVQKLSAAASDLAKTSEPVAKLTAMGQLPIALSPADSRARMIKLLSQYQAAVAAGVRMR